MSPRTTQRGRNHFKWSHRTRCRPLCARMDTDMIYVILLIYKNQKRRTSETQKQSGKMRATTERLHKNKLLDTSISSHDNVFIGAGLGICCKISEEAFARSSNIIPHISSYRDINASCSLLRQNVNWIAHSYPSAAVHNDELIPSPSP
jgi:hypothetical protein